MHFGPLQEPIHKELCTSFINIYQVLLQHFVMKKQSISFKIRNYLPDIFPDQIYHTTGGKAVKDTTGRILVLKRSKRKQREKRAILAMAPVIFARINKICGIMIKAANSWLDYKRSKANESTIQ